MIAALVLYAQILTVMRLHSARSCSGLLDRFWKRTGYLPDSSSERRCHSVFAAGMRCRLETRLERVELVGNLSQQSCTPSREMSVFLAIENLQDSMFRAARESPYAMGPTAAIRDRIACL